MPKSPDFTNAAQKFVESYKELEQIAHNTAQEKGWWDCPDADSLDIIADSLDIIADSLDIIAESNSLFLSPVHQLELRRIAAKLRERNAGEMIGLVHSELSEALEALRHGNPPDDKIPAFKGAEAELADVIIRIFDLSHSRKWNVADAVIAKMEMNQGRSYKHGGKEF